MRTLRSKYFKHVSPMYTTEKNLSKAIQVMFYYKGGYAMLCYVWEVKLKIDEKIIEHIEMIQY